MLSCWLRAASSKWGISILRVTSGGSQLIVFYSVGSFGRVVSDKSPWMPQVNHGRATSQAGGCGGGRDDSWAAIPLQNRTIVGFSWSQYSLCQLLCINDNSEMFWREHCEGGTNLSNIFFICFWGFIQGQEGVTAWEGVISIFTCGVYVWIYTQCILHCHCLAVQQHPQNVALPSHKCREKARQA